MAIVHFYSLNIKYCGDCRHEEYWGLAEGQQSLFGGTIGRSCSGVPVSVQPQPNVLPMQSTGEL